METKLVSVIIPSYNRAHILKKTIPSYYQELVGEIILVDDASSDNTEKIIKEIKKQIPIIKYIKLKTNSKQTFAKNKGIMNAKYPFIYFGDDDSFLKENTIKYLMETMLVKKADVVGAKALYMQTRNDLENIDKFILDYDIYQNDITKIVDVKNIENTNFTYSVKNSIEVPYCQACALVKTDIAKKVLFDVKFKGTAYREETDFFLSINKLGYKIYYDSRAIQINLSRDILKREYNTDDRQNIKFFIKSNYYNLKNTFLLFDKHYEFFKEKYDVKDSRLVMKLKYLKKHLLNMINIVYRHLKKRI